MMQFLDRIKQFQTSLLELGVARGVLSLPAPRMASLPALSAESAGPENLFSHFVTEPEITEVARDLYVSGFYNQSVGEAMKALDKFVQEKSGCDDRSGTVLMTHVFGDTKPLLVWGKRKTQSEKDEHKGYFHLFTGSMLGVRNPVTHEHNWIDSAEEALECIVFAQHLLRKAKKASAATKT